MNSSGKLGADATPATGVANVEPSTNGGVGKPSPYYDWLETAEYEWTVLRIQAAYTRTLRLDPTTWRLSYLSDRIEREYPDLDGIRHLFYEGGDSFPTALAGMEKEVERCLNFFVNPAVVDAAREYFLLLATAACHHTRMLCRDEPRLLAEVPISDEGHLYQFLVKVFKQAVRDFEGGYWTLLKSMPATQTAADSCDV
jgi:hypothetical protein